MAEFINDFKCLDCRHCFKRNPLFRLLNDEELARLNQNRLEVNFKAGEIIYKQGSPLTHVVILNEGLGKVYIEGSKNRNLIVNFSKPYEINGGPGMFVDMRHHCSMTALVDCGACFIDVYEFKAVLRENPSFAESFIGEYSKQCLHTFNQFVILTQKNMEGRIAEALIFLKEKISKNGVIKYVTKQDIADLTGMTKESVLRVMKEFKNEGLIDEESHSVMLLDEKALNQIAQYG